MGIIMSSIRKRQRPKEVMKEMGSLYNLFVKRQLDEHGFLLANRSVVLNFMVELCWKFKKRDLRGVEEVKRRYAATIPLDVCNRIIKLVKSKCYYG